MKNYKLDVFKGLIVGLIIPFLMFLFSSLFVFKKTLSDFIDYLLFGDIFTHYLSLMVLFNAVLFFFFINRREYFARGVLMSTFIYAFIVFIIKLSS